jgi:hypothetical protein
MQRCNILKRVLIFFVLFSATLLPVSANSGPIYWQGYPSSEILAVDENCPIEVESEKLYFDLSGGSANSHTISGEVTAAYEMVNPTDKALSVQMAFPFVSSLNALSKDDIAVTADGTALPYELYIGAAVNDFQQQENGTAFAFDDIVSNISNSPYKASHFSGDETGRLYTLEVTPASEQRINLAVEFKFDSTETKVLTSGFNRYERNDSSVRIAAWCYKPEKLEILVLGDDIDYDITAYTDGELKERTDLYTCQASAEKIKLDAYLMDRIEEYKREIAAQTETRQPEPINIAKTQLYNLYASALDKIFTAHEGYGMFSDLLEQDHFARILTIVYSVDFKANSKRKVSVGCRATGTMDRRRTPSPVYTFSYILNPAKNWAGFKNIDIEIITPKEAPYIVNSSIELKEENAGRYTASLDSLPDSDFVFSIYEDRKITASIKAYSSIRYIFVYFAPIAAGGILIAAVLTAIIVLVRRVKGKS